MASGTAVAFATSVQLLRGHNLPRTQTGRVCQLVEKSERVISRRVIAG